MQQANDPTARKGKYEPAHVISFQLQFVLPPRTLNDGNISNLMKDFEGKSKLQISFMEHF